MKVRKLKTRIAAFGLAVLMGISTLSSANAFAAEQTGSEQQTEVQASEQAVTSQKDTSVTADDITKAVSDDTFAVETSMEGIHYDAEKEDVTLVSIKDENGGEYHSDKAGTYIATYMVVPKDKSDSYTITRKVTLTDTEGQAHSEENGGEKQKSDTESEDDSDSPVQNYTDVEIETSEEDASAQAIKELKEDIEEGNVMVLSAAERATSSGSTVTLTKGRTIYYPSYIGNYLTCLFTVNGKIAYCLQSQKASPPSGSYVAQVLDSNKNLQKVLYYGYGGAGDLTGSYLSGKTEDEKYVYTHIAASYAYAGEAGFTGCNYNDLVNAGVIAYINYLFGQEEPPKGELSLSSTKLNAVRDGNIQKTPNITLSGDHRNYVTLSVPENVTAHNLSKGTSVTNGKIQIYGGDTFYLSADLLLTGSYASGNLYGSVGKTWRTLVLTTGDSKQDIGVFESETAAPVSFSVQWLNMTRIELMKKDVNTQNPLSGAVYGIYTDKKCENLLMTMSATGTDGKAVSDYFDSALKTVYVKEITAPTGYKLNTEVYKVAVTAGKTMTVTATDERVTGKVKIAKIDKETLAFKAQGDSVLRGAVYGLYAKEDIVHPDGTTGVLYKQDSLIAQGVIGDDGTLEFSELYLGEMYVKEITPPEGYTLDTTKYEVSVTYEGQDVAEVTRDLTVKEQVKKQAFQLIKVSEDGEQTETDLVAGAGFKVYLISDLTQVKNGKLKPSNGESYTASDFKNYDFSKEQVAVTYENGTAVPVPELITDTKGYAVSPELPYGSYVVVESTTPENLKTIDPFVVNVENDSREPMQWRVFDDRPFEFLLKIVKKDAQTGNTVLKAGASYKIYDVTNKKYVEQVVQYPKKEKISVFETNEEGYLITPQELKCSTYRIEEVKAPEGFVRQGSEESLYDGTTIISPLEQTTKGTYKENPQSGIVITVSSNTAHQIDPDTGAAIVEVEQKNDEQVGSLLLTKKGEQLTEVTGDSVLAKVKALVSKVRNAVSGKEETGIYKGFKYEETGVEGAEFEIYAKDTIYSPDGAKDEAGNPVVRYEKDDLVAKLTTDENGTAVINNLPLGTYYLKEVVAGEITSGYEPPVFDVIRKVLEECGYCTDGIEMDTFVHQQSPDIAKAVSVSKEFRDNIGAKLRDRSRGAGDQGVMVGYACDDTPQLMPMPTVLAHRITRELSACRRSGYIKDIFSDGKAQVTVEYEDGKPVRLESVVVSCQHGAEKSLKKLDAEIREKVLRSALRLLPPDEDTKILINPSGKFVCGGFDADTGLTGRKLMVDTYGSMVPHGGGAFSGKDCSKVDRSAAYMARYIAKNIVAAEFASKCQVSLAYAIGVAEPVMIEVDTFDTGKVCADDCLAAAIPLVFGVTPVQIMESLRLNRPIFRQTAVFGHFGRKEFPWERTDKVLDLQDAIL